MWGSSDYGKVLVHLAIEVGPVCSNLSLNTKIETILLTVLQMFIKIRFHHQAAGFISIIVLDKNIWFDNYEYNSSNQVLPKNIWKGIEKFNKSNIFQWDIFQSIAMSSRYFHIYQT